MDLFFYQNPFINEFSIKNLDDIQMNQLYDLTLKKSAFTQSVKLKIKGIIRRF